MSHRSLIAPSVIAVTMLNLAMLGSACLGQTFNLNARVYGDPHSTSQTLSVSLAAGRYLVIPVSPDTDSDAIWTAWDPYSSTQAWESDFILIFPSEGLFIEVGRFGNFSTAGASFNDPANVPVAFTLPNPAAGQAYIQDHILSDNQGGVSFRIETLCFSDYNDDGYVTGDDYDLFVSDFVNGAQSADVDQNGYVNGDDFDVFSEHFEQGC